MDAPQHVGGGRFKAALPLDQAELPSLASLGLTPHGKVFADRRRDSGAGPAQELFAGAWLRLSPSTLQSLTAEQSCSRLSPHLAFGTLSIRTVHQATEAAIQGSHDPALAYALRGFAGRLRWHCHFMQKLEDEPDIEFQNFARVFDGMRENDFTTRTRGLVQRAGPATRWWTPACARCWQRAGSTFAWRAMLVSFASYHLWVALAADRHLPGSQFLDYEPGIHWSQMQMQSGTTGINTLSIYFPQQTGAGPRSAGLFIRRWVPELARVPLPYLAEPCRMDLAVQRRAGCMIGVDYPLPIVDDKGAIMAAKDRLYGLRKTEAARAEADQVQARHGSRKSGLPASGQRRTAKASHKLFVPSAPS